MLIDGNCQCRGPVVHPRPVAPRPARGRIPGPNGPSLLPARKQVLPGPPNLPIGGGNTVCTSPSGFIRTLKADLPALETGASYPEFCSSPMQKSLGRRADPEQTAILPPPKLPPVLVRQVPDRA